MALDKAPRVSSWAWVIYYGAQVQGRKFRLYSFSLYHCELEKGSVSIYGIHLGKLMAGDDMGFIDEFFACAVTLKSLMPIRDRYL